MELYLQQEKHVQELKEILQLEELKLKTLEPGFKSFLCSQTDQEIQLEDRRYQVRTVCRFKALTKTRFQQYLAKFLETIVEDKSSVSVIANAAMASIWSQRPKIQTEFKLVCTKSSCKKRKKFS